MRKLGCILAITLTVAGLWSHQVAAQQPSKLDACRAAAQRAEPDPTSFKCDWKAVIRTAPGSALIGRYDGRIPGLNATLTILDASAAPAMVAISSVHKSSAHTCSVKATGARAADDALTVTDAAAPGCTIRIVSSGPNRVRVTSNEACRTMCGMRAGFDGTYQLRR